MSFEDAVLIPQNSLLALSRILASVAVTVLALSTAEISCLSVIESRASITVAGICIVSSADIANAEIADFTSLAVTKLSS